MRKEVIEVMAMGDMRPAAAVDTCPEHKGRVLMADLYEGMVLQPHGPGHSRPIRITDVMEGKWIEVVTLFQKGHVGKPHTHSKTDLGMEPYENSLWNATNYCTEIK